MLYLNTLFKFIRDIYRKLIFHSNLQLQNSTPNFIKGEFSTKEEKNNENVRQPTCVFNYEYKIYGERKNDTHIQRETVCIMQLLRLMWANEPNQTGVIF